MVPSRIGRSIVLDHAVACFVAGRAVHTNASETNATIARARYSTALRSLQRILSDQTPDIESEILTAVKILSTLEVSLIISL
jgi:hypothetical protein